MIWLLKIWLLFAPVDSSLTWMRFDEGMAKANREKKQVLIDVYTDWCGWCKKMDKDTYEDARVVQYLNEKFVMIRLNPETESPVHYDGREFEAGVFAQSMGVNGYPATAFFESDGKMVTLVPGYIAANEFLNIITYIGEKKYHEMSFQDFLSQKQAR